GHQQQSGYAQGGAQLCGGVDDPGGGAPHGERNAGAQPGRGNRGQSDPGAARRDARRQRPGAARRGDEPGVGDGDGRQAGRDEPLRRPACQQGRGQRGAGDDGQAERQQHQRGGERAAPQGVLQVQRRQRDGRAGGQRVQEG